MNIQYRKEKVAHIPTIQNLSFLFIDTSLPYYPYFCVLSSSNANLADKFKY